MIMKKPQGTKRFSHIHRTFSQFAQQRNPKNCVSLFLSETKHFRQVQTASLCTGCSLKHPSRVTRYPPLRGNLFSTRNAAA